MIMTYCRKQRKDSLLDEEDGFATTLRHLDRASECRRRKADGVQDRD